MVSASPTNFDNLVIGQPTTKGANRGDVSIEGNFVSASASIPTDPTTGGNPSPGASLGLYLAVPLTAAQLISMFTTPITVIPAPGAGNTIVLDKAMLRMTRTSTQFTGGGAVVVQYHTGTVAAIATIAAANITGSAGILDAARNGIDVANTENDPLEITNATAVFAAGTGTAVLHLWYQIV